MGFRWLLVLGFAHVCAGLHDPLYPGVPAPSYWRVEAEPAAGPHSKPSRVSAPQAASLQPQPRPLSWRFPEDPVDQVRKPPAYFKLRQPDVSGRVAVRCGESQIHVEASQDLLGLGRLVRPEEMLLGGCPATEVDDSARVLVFQSELHECGSTFVMTKDAFIYAFSLVYNPKVLAKSPIIRSQPVVIGLECHYLRKHSLSSAPTKKHDEADEQPSFALQLMTDNWKSERSSSRYVVGDVINLQASVMGNVDRPLRLWVDNCVASTMQGSTSEPRHAFIKNHGCLGDRRTPGSRFMPRSQPGELQFQVEALRFQRLHSTQKTVYITCQLMANPALSTVTVEQKACYFHKQYEAISLDLFDNFQHIFSDAKLLFSRWRAVDGKDQLCACCDSTCVTSTVGDLNEGSQWQAEVTLGPIVIAPNLYFVKQ